jgi:hypothetical protein
MNVETHPEIEVGEKLTPNTITQLQPKATEPIEIPPVNENIEQERIETVSTNNIEYAISAT